MTSARFGQSWRVAVGTALSALLVCLAILHFSERTNLANADLGRHLKNGELFVSESKVLDTNTYSYTNPEFPAVGHHWLSGVIFHWLWQAGGFGGLSIAYTGILLATFLIMWLCAARGGTAAWALLAAVLLLPIIACRTAIRPEGLSTLFLAVEFFILNEYRAGRLHRRWLWALPVVQVIWVNCHILFFLGIVLAAICTLSQALANDPKPEWRHLALVAAVMAAASVLNPFGLRGALQPLTILNAYGYAVAENQPVWFMIRRFPQSALFSYFAAALGIGLLLVVVRLIQEKDWRALVWDGGLMVCFGVLAATKVRAMAMWALIALPVASQALACLQRGVRPQQQAWIGRAVVALAGGCILAGVLGASALLSPLASLGVSAEQAGPLAFFRVLAQPHLWTGLAPGVNGSAQFWRQHRLQGPIFNNYDLGGYLIYHLYPHERVFVDNRPEAYPAEFFSRVYQPMQENEDAWREADERFDFQAIWFYRHDFTARARRFIQRRLQDPRWAPVFADDYAVILVKRQGRNSQALQPDTALQR